MATAVMAQAHGACAEMARYEADLAAARAAQAAEGIQVDAFTCPACLDRIGPCTGIRLMASPAAGADPRFDPEPMHAPGELPLELPQPTHGAPAAAALPGGADGCSDSLCRECFGRLARSCIANKAVVLCPECQGPVPGWLVARVLGPGPGAAYAEVEQLHLNQAESGRLRLWQCPMPDCRNRRVVPPDWDPQRWEDQHLETDDGFVLVDVGRVVYCEACEKRICVPCKCEEHHGLTCGAYQAWKAENNVAEASFARLIEEQLVKPCPECQAPILKSSGCNFIACTVCNSPNGMCWQTGKPRHGPNGCGGGHSCH